jgi:hypothetical protein
MKFPNYISERTVIHIQDKINEMSEGVCLSVC